MILDNRTARSEINRINRMISEEEQTINALFQRIGQTYYAAHRDDPEDNQAGFIRGIFDAIDRIKQHREQINRVRGIAICPNCSAEVTITSAFCNRCGAKMPNSAAPFGGAPVSGGVFGAAPTPPQNPGPAYTAPSYEQVSHSAEPEPIEISCPSCGNICSSSQRFCNRCGGSLVPVDPGTDVPASQEPRQSAASGVKICPNCGTELAEDSAFCLECGQPV